jgi:hypothetical protein
MKKWLRASWRYLVTFILLLWIVLSNVFMCISGNADWIEGMIFVTNQGMLPSDIRHECQFTISENVQLRVAYQIYTGKVNGRQLDPDSWVNEPLAYDYPANLLVVVPYIDYEITHNDGQSWEVFWRFPSGPINEVWPRCESFKKQNETVFSVGNGYHQAITHDGGYTWTILNIDYR